MSGAAEAVAALAGAMALHQDAEATIIRYHRAAEEALAETDLVGRMQAIAKLILAAEATAEVAKRTDALARATLARVMEATGATTIRIPSHVVGLSHKPARVAITDPQAVPATLLKLPPPAPDLAAIGALLRDGRHLPYAELIGNGEPTLSFRSAKQ